MPAVLITAAGTCGRPPTLRRTTSKPFVQSGTTLSAHGSAAMVHVSKSSKSKPIACPSPGFQPKSTTINRVWWGEAADNGAEVVRWAQIIGNAMGAYVLVYCTLQWWFYRSIRKDIEDGTDDEIKK